MRVAGVHLTHYDCANLVDLLHREGRAADLDLARRIDENLERRSKLLGVSPGERGVLLGVLGAPPGRLVQLRRELERS